MEINIVVPIMVRLSTRGKWYRLNLNQYRNWHYRTSNSLKKKFKQELDLSGVDPIDGKYVVSYKVYYDSARKFDLMNYVCVVDKFLMDALQERGIVIEDNIDYYIGVDGIYYMGIDRDNPRVEVKIRKIDKDGDVKKEEDGGQLVLFGGSGDS